MGAKGRATTKNLEECERSGGTTASFCSICSKAGKIATYGGNDVFGHHTAGSIRPWMVTQRVLRSMWARACVWRLRSFVEETRVNPEAGSRPNTFSVSTVRQLVCGSSRNLNPMILGTDPSRVPNPRREPPSALKAADYFCRCCCLEERERTKEDSSLTISLSAFTKESWGLIKIVRLLRRCFRRQISYA